MVAKFTCAFYGNIIIAGCVFGTRSFSQVTIIARTNLGLFEEMARVLRTPGGDKKRLGFVGVRGRKGEREREKERELYEYCVFEYFCFLHNMIMLIHDVTQR